MLCTILQHHCSVIHLFFFSSRRRHTRFDCDWSSDVCSSDLLVEVIDQLLQAPEVSAPIKLVQPKVFYEYADADLESRSAGQKLLIRMGAANARAIKAKLREFRAEIVKKK